MIVEGTIAQTDLLYKRMWEKLRMEFEAMAVNGAAITAYVPIAYMDFIEQLEKHETKINKQGTICGGRIF